MASSDPVPIDSEFRMSSTEDKKYGPASPATNSTKTWTFPTCAPTAEEPVQRTKFRQLDEGPDEQQARYWLRTLVNVVLVFVVMSTDRAAVIGSVPAAV